VTNALQQRMRPDNANSGATKIRYALQWRSSNPRLRGCCGQENDSITIAMRIFVDNHFTGERAVDMCEVTGGKNHAENPPN